MDLGKVIGEFPAQLLYASLIALIFSGTGRIWSQVTHRRSSATAGMQMGQVMGGLPAPHPAPQPAPHQIAHPVARHGVNYGRVLLHIGVFQLAINVVAFVIGFLLGALLLAAGQSTTSEEARALFFLVTLVFGTLALIVGFLIIGLRVERSIRWLHMTYVALGLAVTTVLINWWAGVFHPTSVAVVIGAVIFALIQTFFGMGVGGGLSFLIGGKQDVTPRPATMSQPYPYGAQRNAPLYPPQPGQPAYPQPYPPQQQGPYYPPNYPPNPGAPQYPQQQGAPQHPQRPPAGAPQPYPPAPGQPPLYPPQYPPQQGAPQYPPRYPPQQPPAGGQGGQGQ